MQLYEQYYIAVVGARVLKLSTHSVPPAQDSEAQAWQPIDEPNPADFVWVDDRGQVYV